MLGDGLGVVIDDLREADVLGKLLLDAPVPFASATPGTGFTGAASGVVSIADAAMALRNRVLHPMVRRNPDPDCRVHSLPAAGPLGSPNVLVWNSERGAKNVAVLLTRSDG